MNLLQMNAMMYESPVIWKATWKGQSLTWHIPKCGVAKRMIKSFGIMADKDVREKGHRAFVNECISYLDAIIDAVDVIQSEADTTEAGNKRRSEWFERIACLMHLREVEPGEQFNMQILSFDLSLKRCAVCTLLICDERCGYCFTYYCSSEHHLQDWPTHKLQCLECKNEDGYDEPLLQDDLFTGVDSDTDDEEVEDV